MNKMSGQQWLILPLTCERFRPDGLLVAAGWSRCWRWRHALWRRSRPCHRWPWISWSSLWRRAASSSSGRTPSRTACSRSILAPPSGSLRPIVDLICQLLPVVTVSRGFFLSLSSAATWASACWAAPCLCCLWSSWRKCCPETWCCATGSTWCQLRSDSRPLCLCSCSTLLQDWYKFQTLGGPLIGNRLFCRSAVPLSYCVSALFELLLINSES